MKTVFMGTPDFAADILEALTEAGHEVLCSVTREDTQKGRGKAVSFSPVKELSLKHNIEVFQPHRIKDEDSVRFLKGLGADVFIVAAYGKILSQEILEIPKYGCVNVHASLLPKYRGPAPIQQAVINGDKISGVTIMQMDKGVDTGDILLQRKIALSEDETGESLFEKLSKLGGQALCEALSLMEKGELCPVKQNDSEASYTRALTKEDGRLDFTGDAESLERLVRGLYSWPGSFTFHKGRLLKVFSAKALSGESYEKLPCGMIVDLKDGITVSTKKGFIRFKEIQLEGKKRMKAEEFLRGYKMETGEFLGQEGGD